MISAANSGGGAFLKGLDELIYKETGMPVHIAESPLDCVALGTGKALDKMCIRDRDTNTIIIIPMRILYLSIGVFPFIELLM